MSWLAVEFNTLMNPSDVASSGNAGVSYKASSASAVVTMEPNDWDEGSLGLPAFLGSNTPAVASGKSIQLGCTVPVTKASPFESTAIPAGFTFPEVCRLLE